MYYAHYGLDAPPFKITPDTHLFYSGGNRGLVLEALQYAIYNGEGIIKVVGEVGSGKTMLCRMLETKLPQPVEIVYIANPSLSPEMILHAIAIEMRLPVTPQDNRLQVMQALNQHLLDKHAANQQVVMFIEEAQNMPLETLEEIRLLSNLETTRHKLLQIVLFGQPELDTNLAATHIRQLKERITHSFYLTALQRRDIDDYIKFRMREVGYRGAPVFTPAAIGVITRISKGLMRRINILADKALLAAFADNQHVVTAKHIRLAAKDSGFAPARRRWLGWVVGILLVLSVVTGFAFSFLYWDKLIASNMPVASNTVIAIPPESINPAESFAEPEPLPANVVTAKPAPVSAEIQPNPISESLLEQRLQATMQWLAEVDDTLFTIQVMQIQLAYQADLEKLLAKPEIQPLLSQLYIYRTHDGQEWRVLYGEFVDGESAGQAVANLPEMLRRNKPYWRKIARFK